MQFMLEGGDHQWRGCGEMLTLVESLFFSIRAGFCSLRGKKDKLVRLNVEELRKHDKKICCLWLTSLLSLPAEQLPDEGLERAFRATLEPLVSFKDQVADSIKEEDLDTNGFQTDDEDDEDDSENEMVDDEDEDEASSQC